MDDLTIALVMCIGSAVAWLVAFYTERGLSLLLWNVLFGMVGAALCAQALSWAAPPLVQAMGLVTVVPLSALLMIFVGHAIRRAVLTRQRPPPKAPNQRAADLPPKGTAEERVRLGKNGEPQA